MTLHVISIALYLGGSLALLVFALRYFLNPTVMPYHLVAMGKRWDEVEPATRFILLALMRCAAAGYLTTTVAAVWLVIAGVMRHQAWANGALLMIFVSLLLPLTWVMLKVRRLTPGRPPIVASVIGLGATVVAFVCECVG
jgi:hypothetical protein